MSLGCPCRPSPAVCLPLRDRFGSCRSLRVGRGCLGARLRLEPPALIFNGFGVGFFAFALSLLLAARGFAEAVRLVYTTTVTRARRGESATHGSRLPRNGCLLINLDHVCAQST